MFAQGGIGRDQPLGGDHTRCLRLAAPFDLDGERRIPLVSVPDDGAGLDLPLEGTVHHHGQRTPVLRRLAELRGDQIPRLAEGCAPRRVPRTGGADPPALAGVRRHPLDTELRGVGKAEGGHLAVAPEPGFRVLARRPAGVGLFQIPERRLQRMAWHALEKGLLVLQAGQIVLVVCVFEEPAIRPGGAFPIQGPVVDQPAAAVDLVKRLLLLRCRVDPEPVGAAYEFRAMVHIPIDVDLRLG